MRDTERQSRGFAYVYFCSIAEQQKALEHPQHIIDDNTLKVRPKERVAEELTIYVGGLSPKTLSTDLSDFYSKYDRLVQSSVVKDAKTRRSKLFGCVTFATGEGLEAALNDEPHVINGKQVEVSYLDKSLSLFVGCISPKTTEDSLRESLSKFGKIVSVTVKPGYGFVIFDTRQAVESAMAAHPYKIDSTFVVMKQQQPKDQPQQIKLVLYLQRLPVEATEEDLYNFYSKFGKVFKTAINKQEGANKAAGMVHFENEKEMLHALNSQPHEICGKKVLAKFQSQLKSYS
uniref:RRM domain-containing protein n=1 Tax=Ditylenchus dipsaci TaxID=166011 RepID=A0A915ERD2_9BILA